MPALVVLMIMLLPGAAEGHAFDKARAVSDGNALFREGEYEASLEKYLEALQKDSESDIINFNAGTAYYKNADYPKAIAHLNKSLLTEDPGLKEKAYYNLGNALYQDGIGREDRHIEEAINALEQALAQYEKAAEVSGGEDADREHNYAFVQAELERLKLKQQQQQQQQQSGQNEQDRSKQDRRPPPAGGSDQPEDQPKDQDGSEEDKSQADEEDSPQEDPGNDDGEEQGGRPPGETAPGQKRPPQGADMENPEDMTPEEADMFLDDYQQNKENQGLLNFMKRKGREVPVMRDW